MHDGSLYLHTPHCVKDTLSHKISTDWYSVLGHRLTAIDFMRPEGCLFDFLQTHW
jgi:hypothetical protein